MLPSGLREMAAFFEARAMGGVGLIVTGTRDDETKALRMQRRNLWVESDTELSLFRSIFPSSQACLLVYIISFPSPPALAAAYSLIETRFLFLLLLSRQASSLVSHAYSRKNKSVFNQRTDSHTHISRPCVPQAALRPTAKAASRRSPPSSRTNGRPCATAL